jgi:cobalt/nickel transport protein
MTAFQKKLWAGLLVMAILSPMGILLPHYLNADDAWGEWSSEKLKDMIGYVPEGLEKLADLWKAPIADYNPGGEGTPLWAQILWYIFSGMLGIIIVGGSVYLLARILRKNER